MFFHRSNPSNDTSGQTYTVIDFETTGFSAAKDKIVSAAAIHLDGTGRELSRAYSLINPERPINEHGGAYRVNGIGNADVVGKPTWVQFAPRIREMLLGGSMFVAHNASFDMQFYKAEEERLGQTVSCPVLCTMELFGGSSGYIKLGEACRQNGVKLKHAHNAMADALACAELLRVHLRGAAAR